MRGILDWPKKPIFWVDGSMSCISVPFTWQVEEIVRFCEATPQIQYLVGGPAVYLMNVAWPKNVTIGKHYDGVLQRANPNATRTTTGCPNKCRFCAVGSGIIEGNKFTELEHYPLGWAICDNNLLAASEPHFDKVMRMLRVFGKADFNQGLDARLLNERHARGMASIGKDITIRMAMDNPAMGQHIDRSIKTLKAAGIAKYKVRVFCLIGHTTGYQEAWDRCKWVEGLGVKPLPMWYHSLRATQCNKVSEDQERLGWNDYERRRIMKWFYQHQDISKKVVKS